MKVIYELSIKLFKNTMILISYSFMFIEYKNKIMSNHSHNKVIKVFRIKK